MAEEMNEAEKENKLFDLPTTIRLRKGTKYLLDSFKVIGRETYDSVIERMVQNFAEEHLDINKQTKSLLSKRMRKMNEGKVLSINELLQKMREKREMDGKV